MTALVSSICEPPRPSTIRRMVDSLATDNSRPTENNKNATPSAAMPATFCTSLMVNKPTIGIDLPNEPSPKGPNMAPAPR